jgi:hypothetical protein
MLMCVLVGGLSGMASPSATRLPGALRKQSPILPRQDVATTRVSATATGEVFIVGRMIRITVIVGQFFAVSDIAEGHQPDRAGRLGDFAVRITGAVAIACRVPEDCAINIIALIEGKNIDIALGEASRTFGFGNLLPNVGENPGPLPNMLRRKEPKPSNTRFPHPDTYFHRILITLTST